MLSVFIFILNSGVVIANEITTEDKIEYIESLGISYKFL